ncbi:hypothetical protein G7054_g9 [Neopestalotiopsis clavispora]|nr:hypothetical protein G7054_g9 [Neopestalotiopsis clavispora]
MNWTEGNLARHSRGRANNEVLRRQKQHFARARSRMLSGHARHSPVTISFLDGTHKHHTRTASWQSSPHVQEEDTSRSSERHSNESRSPWHPRNAITGTRHTRDSRQEGNTLSNGHAYHADNRKRPALAEIFNQEQVNEKRRRLLDKPDWAGLEMQQPIDLVLPGQAHTSSGRRWSKILPDNPRHILSTERRGDLTRPRNENHSREHLGTFQQRPAGPIRVRVGSQSVTHTADSHEWPSSAGHMQAQRLLHSPPSIPQRAQMSAFLQWSPSSKSDDSGSIHAQIGRPKRRPPSELAADARWLEHIMPAENLCIPLTRGSSLLESPPYRPDVSPGISELLSQSSQVHHQDHEGLSVDPSSAGTTRSASLHVTNQSSLIFKAEKKNMASQTTPCLESVHLSEEQQGKPVITHSLESFIGRAGDTQPCEHSKSAEDDAKVSQPDTDDNAAWMKFVFGDGGEVESQARVFQEAVHEAAEKLCLPSTPRRAPVILLDGNPSYEAKVAQNSDQSMSAQRGSEEKSSDSVATSQLVTIGSLSPEERPANQDLEEWEDFLLAHPTNISDIREPTSPSKPLDAPSRSIDSPKSDKATVDDSTISAISQPIFRFSAPQTFIGKLARSGIKLNDISSRPDITGRRGHQRTTARRCTRKKRSDERTDIRALPDFDGDPIEG